MEPRHYASFLWRVLASLIDFAIAIFASVVTSVLVSVPLVVVLAILPLNQAMKDQASTLTGYIIGLIVPIVYYAGLESSPWQATFGKRLTGLTVTDLNGNRIGFGRAVVRFFLKFISGFLGGIAFLVCLFTEHKQALHDILVGTLVLREKKEEQKQEA